MSNVLIMIIIPERSYEAEVRLREEQFFNKTSPGEFP